MAHVSKIKQCRQVDDNQVNQLFKADETKEYYQWQALKIDDGIVSPVEDVDEVVFGICEETRGSSEYGFNVTVRQPRMGDTYTVETDFDLDEDNVGTYYGIAPDGEGGYQISATWESKQWRLMAVLGPRVWEFEFERADGVTDAAIASLDERVTALEG